MAAELLIFLAPLIKKAVDNYLSDKIPEKVSLEIQDHVQKVVNVKLKNVLDGIESTKNQYISLAALSVILTLGQFFSKNEDYSHILFVCLYAIPLYMSVRSLRNFYYFLLGIMKLEEVLKADISQALDEAGFTKKLLVKTYDKRSVDDLAKFTAGTIVFELISRITTDKSVILKSVISYFVSFNNILFIRYFL